ncbi:hypothetical protein NHX12_010849 [Muraenolepis orangiensis]|uniref:Uncharacterized protein n=1 Tax=Muraenolepis orangiensis TaxID=630683 RepID=A0A9Q0DGK5_9TELE|nr:hypothetical protein NHX12_010849 [Muraenolepis orangiensis]
MNYNSDLDALPFCFLFIELLETRVEFGGRADEDTADEDTADEDTADEGVEREHNNSRLIESSDENSSALT